MLEEYKGWEIRQAETWYFSFQRYFATSPGYSPSYEGPEDGWVTNGHVINGESVEDVKKQIDEFIEENSDAE
tara:strand:+ start:780 stop:995 length:216 start_codon:yes stop_codon:yes gene_type:complete